MPTTWLVLEKLWAGLNVHFFPVSHVTHHDTEGGPRGPKEAGWGLLAKQAAHFPRDKGSQGLNHPGTHFRMPSQSVPEASWGTGTDNVLFLLQIKTTSARPITINQEKSQSGL